MLNVPLSTITRNNLADKHAAELLDLLKKRLKKSANKFLKAYFDSDNKILDLLKTKPQFLKQKNNSIIASLVSAGHIKADVEAAASRIFDYKYFFKKNDKLYCAFDMCRDIGLMTCPYCNINFVNTIHGVKARKLVLRPPLDHFLAYSRYPFVALSFYNLIPSCWICNSSFKTTQDTDVTTHLNPYQDSFGDNCVLDFKNYKTIDDILGNSAYKYRVYFNNKAGDPRFDGNIGLFKLDDCYNAFRSVARRSLIAAMQYNEDTIKGILKAVKGNKEETYRMIFHSEFSPNEHHLLPFSKINRDIVKQYGSTELKDILGL